MNPTNVAKAIAVMERVRDRGDRLQMNYWQFGDENSNTLGDENALHTCGTAACFGGWVAVSTEWEADGGGVSHHSGAPILGEGLGDEAIAEWLDIDESDAEDLCATSSETDINALYGVPADEITVIDVLAVLYRLRDTGSMYLGESQS